MGGSIVKKQRAELEKKRYVDKIFSNKRSYFIKHKTLPDIHSLIPRALSIYSHCFIRSPEDWVCNKKSEDARRYSALRWLFAKYPVPKFLDQIWANKRSSYHKYEPWYISIAQGQSFYKNHVKSFMTRKATHFFLTKSPPDFTVEQAVWWAKAISAGALHGFAKNWAMSRIAGYDFDDKFANEAMNFFVNNPVSSRHELSDLFDYIINKKEEDNYFSFKGRTLESVRKHSNQWHDDLMRIKKGGNDSWEPLPVPDWHIEFSGKRKDKPITYSIYQLLNSKELSKEGAAMRHCVYAYASLCKSGESGIFVLHKKEFEDGRGAFVTRRCLTIQVTKDMHLIQARGFCNRQPNPVEKNVLAKWKIERKIR